MPSTCYLINGDFLKMSTNENLKVQVIGGPLHSLWFEFSDVLLSCVTISRYRSDYESVVRKTGSLAQTTARSNSLIHVARLQ